MDTWECEQPSWTRTAKVLRHHQAILDGTVTNEMDTWECERPSRTRTAKVLKHHQAILDGTDTNKINNPAPSKRRRRDKRDFINEGIDYVQFVRFCKSSLIKTRCLLYLIFFLLL